MSHLHEQGMIHVLLKVFFFTFKSSEILLLHNYEKVCVQKFYFHMIVFF